MAPNQTSKELKEQVKSSQKEVQSLDDIPAPAPCVAHLTKAPHRQAETAASARALCWGSPTTTSSAARTSAAAVSEHCVRPANRRGTSSSSALRPQSPAPPVGTPPPGCSCARGRVCPRSWSDTLPHSRRLLPGCPHPSSRAARVPWTRWADTQPSALPAVADNGATVPSPAQPGRPGRRRRRPGRRRCTRSRGGGSGVACW